MISPDSTSAGIKSRDFRMTNVVSRDYPRNSLLGLLRTLIFQHMPGNTSCMVDKRNLLYWNSARFIGQMEKAAKIA